MTEPNDDGASSASEEPLAVEIQRLDPRSLRILPPEENARFMTERQMGQLVENLERDGVLTSVPLVAPDPDGTLSVVSGNHRVEAALGAGIHEIDVQVITSKLSPERRRAIQLSHNAIVGQDDPNTLGRLWEGLDLRNKLYSGITDDDLGGLANVDISGLSIGNPRYEEVALLFLPEDRELFLGLLAEIEKRAKATFAVGALSSFNTFFDAVVEVKQARNVKNNALAIQVMAELALERIAQLEAEGTGDGS